jgi:hypothetical protein
VVERIGRADRRKKLHPAMDAHGGRQRCRPRPLTVAVTMLWLLLLLLPCVADGGPTVATFAEPNGQRLQHLTVDKHSALVYIGGVNRLYQLSPELERQVTVETGPRDDSPECPVVDCLQTVVKRPTDNINKALVIDYTDTRLISCGTLFQGSSISSQSHVVFIHLKFEFFRVFQESAACAT